MVSIISLCNLKEDTLTNHFRQLLSAHELTAFYSHCLQTIKILTHYANIVRSRFGFGTLPMTLLNSIFEFLSYGMICQCSVVSRSWKETSRPYISTKSARAYVLEMTALHPRPTDTKNINRSLLGQGTAKVYRAKYQGKDVAVKLFPDQINLDSKYCERLMKVDHHNIAHIYGIEFESSCLVMELAELGSLHNIILNTEKYPHLNPHTENTIYLQIIMDIANGLHCLHNKEIFHNDLNAKSILIRKDWSAFIGDFQIAENKKTVNPMTVQDNFYWRAPEYKKHNSTPRTSAAIDIYSLGMIMDLLLTRKIPFSSEQQQSKSSRLMKYIRLMEECKSQDPNKRPSASKVILQIQSILETDSGSKEQAGSKEIQILSSERFSLQWKLPGLFIKSNPHSITSDQESLYIASRHPLNFYQYNLEGQLLETWSPQSLSSQFFNTDAWSPWDIECVNDLLYITHRGTPPFLTVIEKLSKKIVSQWNLPHSCGGPYFKVDSDRIYVSITQLNQIIIYSLTGEIITKFGKKGKEPGEFGSPCGLTVDQKFLYICDSLNHRIQVLDKMTGYFIHQWCTRQEQSFFSAPEFITLYETFFYISDFWRVQIYNRRGEFIRYVGKGGYGQDREFSCPRGVCIVKKKLYVCDYDNNRIQVFSYGV